MSRFGGAAGVLRPTFSWETTISQDALLTMWSWERNDLEESRHEPPHYRRGSCNRQSGARCLIRRLTISRVVPQGRWLRDVSTALCGLYFSFQHLGRALIAPLELRLAIAIELTPRIDVTFGRGARFVTISTLLPLGRATEMPTISVRRWRSFLRGFRRLQL